MSTNKTPGKYIFSKINILSYATKLLIEMSMIPTTSKIESIRSTQPPSYQN